MSPPGAKVAEKSLKSVSVYMCEECNSVFLSQDILAVHILAEHMGKTLPSEQVTFHVTFHVIFNGYTHVYMSSLLSNFEIHHISLFSETKYCDYGSRAFAGIPDARSYHRFSWTWA